MKLSKKGRDRMWDFAGDGWGYVEYGEKEELEKALEDMNFSQEDFKDCVVLTLDEAKEISLQLYKLAQLYSLLTLGLDPDKSQIKQVAKSYEPLNKKIAKAMKTIRIEQAIKENEKRTS